MAVPQLIRHKIALDTYHRMIDQGMLGKDAPLELIQGEIIQMSPRGTKHTACLRRVLSWLPESLGDKASSQVQDSIHIPSFSAPAPDWVWIRPRVGFYSAVPPLPEDVWLPIDIAVSSFHQSLHPAFRQFVQPQTHIPTRGKTSHSYFGDRNLSR